MKSRQSSKISSERSRVLLGYDLSQERRRLGILESLFSGMAVTVDPIYRAASDHYHTALNHSRRGSHDGGRSELGGLEDELRKRCGDSKAYVVFEVLKWRSELAWQRNSVSWPRDPRFLRNVAEIRRCATGLLKHHSKIFDPDLKMDRRLQVLLHSLNLMHPAPSTQRKKTSVKGTDRLTVLRNRILTAGGVKAVEFLVPFFAPSRRWTRVAGKRRARAEGIVPAELYRTVSRLLEYYSLGLWKDSMVARDRLRAAYRRRHAK